jgi:hypothetical protein
MPPRLVALVVLGVALGPSGVPASAADLALSLDAGWYDMAAASRSARAVFGSRGGPTAGGAVHLGLGAAWFVGAGARWFQQDGERVFTRGDGEPVFRLGHPLTVRILPVYGFLGYRLRPHTRLVPYAMAGAGVATVRERATVAEITETAASTRASGHLAAGVEYGRGTVRLGAEVMFTTIPRSAGIGGVSAVYDEKDVGGVAVVARVAFRR